MTEYLKSVLVVIALLSSINPAKCDYGKSCYQMCLTNSARNPNSNIDIYLEYKKAVIKVPDPPKIDRDRFITLPNGEIIPEVNLRQVAVDPVEESCNSNSQMKTRKKINCKPRPFVLEVVSTNGKVFPNKVLTKQCAGYCSGNTICTAIRSKNISASVNVVLEDGRTSCSTILVPQDTKCKCQCATTEKDCNANQKFNKKLCSCECTNKIEKDHCERKIEKFYSNQHFWDIKTCSCACKRESLCTTGTVWDKSRCRCSKKTDNG